MTIAAPTTRAIPAIAEEVPEIRRSVLRRTWMFCRRQPLGTFGMALVIIMALAGLFADWIAPYSPTANDFAAMTEPPSWAHWLGTDQLGRDLLSRILFGARTAFIVGLTSSLIGGVLGLVVGGGSAYFCGPLGLLLPGIPRIFVAVPPII